MPKITKLGVQKRNAERYNIHIDGKYRLAVSTNVLLAQGLHVGQELTEQQIDELEQSAEFGKAYDLAINYINLRRRSAKEIRDYLWRKKYDKQVAEAIVERLLGVGLLNDAEFAAAWVRDRLLLKPRSKRALQAELAAKGISRENTDIALAELDTDSEVEQVKELMQKKLQQKRYQEDTQKLLATVVRQGYSYSDAKTALQQINDENVEQ